jgi:hypothetical protein
VSSILNAVRVVQVEIPYTFATASALATEVLKTSGNADAVAIVYNAFKRYVYFQ